MTQEIIVTGSLRRDDAAYVDAFGQTRNLNYNQNTSQWNDVPSSTPLPTDDPNDRSDTVRVTISNPANEAEALAAAANLLAALRAAKDALAALPANTPVLWHGQDTTTGAVLQTLRNTEFTITDQSNFGNGGVGTATYDPSGHHSVVWNFEAFDGDGVNDYAHPNYSGFEGMVGILLHDVGHLSAEADSYDDLSHAHYRQETGSDFGYVSSDYWSNMEAYANDFAAAVAGAANIDISEYAPLQGTYWRTPADIHIEHMGI